jgi:BirA family biotin operon repressor/biotin-[acetyl-CoA-carboxylase] ligase
MIEKMFDLLYNGIIVAKGGDGMKYEILDMLKKSGGYVSGEDIGEKLSVSRTAVWKNISKLKEEGYSIKSVSNKGYLLEDGEEVLNSYELGSENCLCLDSVDSTNEEAKRQATKGFEDGLLIVARHQLSGKGRLGRVWEDETDKSATFSILLKPNISPVEASQFTLVAGLAVAKAINELTVLNAKIKWPNDVVVNGKKLVGILTEMSASMESINYVVVGIGINVNTEKFDGELEEKATSLLLECGKKFGRAEVIKKFSEVFMPMYDIFCNDGFKSFCKEYNEMCVNIGKDVLAIKREKTIKGKAVCVAEDGCIEIETENGTERIMCGEVSIRTSDNKYV